MHKLTGLIQRQGETTCIVLEDQVDDRELEPVTLRKDGDQLLAANPRYPEVRRRLVLMRMMRVCLADVPSSSRTWRPGVLLVPLIGDFLLGP